MKKLLSISLALLLLMSTIGVTIHRHYCESTLVATSLIPGIDDACDSDMPMDDDTCRDDHQHYSVDSPLVMLSLNYELAPSIEWVQSFETIVTNLLSEKFVTSKFYADLSPPPSEPNIYTKVQAFLL